VIDRPTNPLIVAIDVSDAGAAERLASSLGPEVGMLKVGLELIWAEGPSAVGRVGRHGPVFVDAKLHDIPATVEAASFNVAKLGVAMMNVHALGGEAMMRAALRGAERASEETGHPVPLVVAVTVLTSRSGEELASPASLAYEARTAGLHGVVVSGHDAPDVRAVCGEDFVLVVPGIRPAGSNGDDHVHVFTPAEAIERGADYVVVGRPVTRASDPAGAARAIVRAL